MNAIRLLLIALLTSVVLSGCSDSIEQPLHIGTNVWPGYQPLYLARQLDYFKDRRVQLVEYPSTTKMMDAFQHGTLDAATLTLDEALALRARGQDPVVVLVMAISAGGDALLARPGIHSMRALKGRRIGIESTTLGRYFLARACEKSGVALQSMHIVPLESTRHESAFHSGKVDALVTFDPVRTHLVAGGAQVLFDSSKIPDEIVDVLVVRRQVLQQRPAEIRQLLQDWFKTVDYLKSQPRDAALHMADPLGMEVYDVLTVYQHMRLPDVSENKLLLGGEKPVLQQTADRMARMMYREGLVRQPLQSASLFSTQLIFEIESRGRS